MKMTQYFMVKKRRFIPVKKEEEKPEEKPKRKKRIKKIEVD